MAECARQLVSEPYLVLLNDVCSSPHYVWSKSAAIVFRVVFIIVRLFNTFDIIDICVLCVWHDSIKVIYYIIIHLLDVLDSFTAFSCHCVNYDEFILWF